RREHAPEGVAFREAEAQLGAVVAGPSDVVEDRFRARSEPELRDVDVVPEDRHGANRGARERSRHRQAAPEPSPFLDDRGRRRGDGHWCCSSARPASHLACCSGWFGGLGASHQPVLSGPATARSRSTFTWTSDGPPEASARRTAGSTSSGAVAYSLWIPNARPIAAKSGE